MEQPAPQDDLIGATIGNYQVRQKLGEGGMGSVYLAEHPLIGKKVAVKILHPEYVANEDVVHRFFTEAKAVTEIQHPNIVEVLDYGTLPSSSGKTVYFVMEFLNGLSLGQLLAREGALNAERALNITLQVADALSACHAKGIIHRDLKPDNVMLIQRGREVDFVKVLDFGIAKLTGGQDTTKKTRAGVIMGTPAYMSPEQCEGLGRIDARTDVYSLGILLYEMITGSVPFKGQAYGDVLVQHLTREPEAPSTIAGIIPPHVESVVLKALRKRPDDRFPTMTEMAKAVADPVAYVETNGGIDNFQATPLAVTPLPMPIPSRDRSGPYHQITHNTSQANTVADSMSGIPQSKPSKAPIFVGLALLAIATGVILYFAMGIGGGAPTADAASSPQAAIDASRSSSSQSESSATTSMASSSSSSSVLPQEVTITFESSPTATVYLDGKKLGRTPKAIKIPKSDATRQVVFKRSRYYDEEKEFAPNGNHWIEVVMTRKSSGGHSGSSDKSSSSSSDGGLIPFKPKKTK